MNKLYPILLLTILPVCIYAQDNEIHNSAEDDDIEEYTSSELIKYYREKDYRYSGKRFTDYEDMLNLTSGYCSVSGISDYATYVDSIIRITPYNDSVMKAETAQINTGCITSGGKREYVGGIYKGNIIKYEKRGAFEAFLYTDSKFTDIYFADLSIWIAVSNDSGANWSHYFTGLYEYQPFALKWYSKLPLIVDDRTLQIEATCVRQTHEHSHPVCIPLYAPIKDGIVLTFDMNVITKDSDGDGLTDIVEEKFRTNPFNRDTNKNGIPDNLDLNPRLNIKRSKSTIVFETILNKKFKPVDWSDMNFTGDPSDSTIDQQLANYEDWEEIPPNTTGIFLANDSVKTILIVTDDPAIMAMRPKYVRAIILSSEEYKKSRNRPFKSELDKFTLTPLCKVDEYEDLYLIQYDGGTESKTYLVQKTENGWRIKLLYTVII